MNFEKFISICIYFSFMFLFLESCNRRTLSNQYLEAEETEIRNLDSENTPSPSEVNEVVCDSIFGKVGYKIVLTRFDLDETSYEINNSVLALYKLVDRRYIPIYSDSIYCRFSEISFADFNGDHVKDILILNNSSARSNRMYYLYLVDNKKDLITKIHGFENIPNPAMLPDQIIIGCAVSGRDWMNFYEIQGDSIS